MIKNAEFQKEKVFGLDTSKNNTRVIFLYPISPNYHKFNLFGCLIDLDKFVFYFMTITPKSKLIDNMIKTKWSIKNTLFQFQNKNLILTKFHDLFGKIQKFKNSNHYHKQLNWVFFCTDNKLQLK